VLSSHGLLSGTKLKKITPQQGIVLKPIPKDISAETGRYFNG